jgi:SAM-dependent methyltransferase
MVGNMLPHPSFRCKLPAQRRVDRDSFLPLVFSAARARRIARPLREDATLTLVTRLKADRAEWQRYLVVDDFLGDAVHVAALATAFECGLIDALLEGPLSSDDLARACGREPQRMSLLIGLLAGGRVLAKKNKLLSLCPRFSAAMEFRDLLEAKARYSRIVLSDLAERFTDLAFDFPAYVAASRAYSLFRYHTGASPGPDEVAAAEHWVSLTTVASRYEAAALMHHFDFGQYRRILDIGGNSGELARRICERHPQMRVDVFDLPVVCDIGRRHVAGTPEADRIGFIAGDARVDQLPGGYDVCLFKSMLHDWPDEQARLFLDKALGALAPGGRLLAFERSQLDASRLKAPMRAVLSLPFWPCFRQPATYVSWLQQLGGLDVIAQRIALDVDFMLVTAVARPGRDRPRVAALDAPAAGAASGATVIRFRNDQEERALELSVEAFVAGVPAFFVTRRFSLSYRPWPGTNVTDRPRVQRMLAAARAALFRADEAGLALEQARHAVASSATGGWVLIP